MKKLIVAIAALAAMAITPVAAFAHPANSTYAERHAFATPMDNQSPDFAAVTADAVAQLDLNTITPCNTLGQSSTLGVPVAAITCNSFGKIKGQFGSDWLTWAGALSGPAQSVWSWASALPEPDFSRGHLQNETVKPLNIKMGGSLAYVVVASYGGVSYPSAPTYVTEPGTISIHTTIPDGQTNIWWQVIWIAQGSNKPDQVSEKVQLNDVTYDVAGPLIAS